MKTKSKTHIFGVVSSLDNERFERIRGKHPVQLIHYFINININMNMHIFISFMLCQQEDRKNIECPSRQKFPYIS